MTITQISFTLKHKMMTKLKKKEKDWQWHEIYFNY